MRLGGPIPLDGLTPATWVAALAAKGYRAAYCPVGLEADAATIAAYRQAAVDADIVIAEVGAWSNPLSPDPAEAAAALAKNIAALRLAEAIGARCCVNISGARGARWAGPHPENLTAATFDRIVTTVQTILDAVQPQHTTYTLETMPWAYPDSVASYERLIAAIDRPGMAVHFDPVNVINCPARYFANAEVVRDFVARLGPRIRSVHVKDVLLHDTFLVHLDEVRPGLGTLDHDVLLTELARLDPDLPLMMEHLPTQEEYAAAAAHLRQVAAAVGVML